MDEKTKKWLKIAGIIIGLLLLYGIFNLFYGDVSREASYHLKGNESGLSQEAEYSTGYPVSDLSLEASMPKATESRMENLTESKEIPAGDEESQEKRVIKNGNFSLKVADTEAAADKISEIAKSKEGEVFSSNFYERVKGSKSGDITVKVPVEKFEETMNEIRKIATQVVSESTTGQDVTEQYADLQAQLKNKRSEEQAFVKILDQSGKIEDILKVTKEISRVRGEIERLEGRIKYLESQTDMSVISVYLSEDVEIKPIGEDWRPWQVVKSSVKTLIKNIQNAVDGVIYFLIVSLPAIILWVIIILIAWTIGRKIWKKFKK